MHKVTGFDQNKLDEGSLVTPGIPESQDSGERGQGPLKTLPPLNQTEVFGFAVQEPLALWDRLVIFQ